MTTSAVHQLLARIDGDERWFTGKIVRLNEMRHTVMVLYDDGEEKWHTMWEDKYVFLSPVGGKLAAKSSMNRVGVGAALPSSVAQKTAKTARDDATKTGSNSTTKKLKAAASSSPVASTAPPPSRVSGPCPPAPLSPPRTPPCFGGGRHQSFFF